MALYSYSCPFGPHEIDDWFPIGTAPASVPCPEHYTNCNRQYGHININSGDPFRTAWLSETKASSDGRPVDPLAPKDKHDAKDIERATGRVYFGNDLTALSKESRAALDPQSAERTPVIKKSGNAVWQAPPADQHMT
jgi:hypothetical protein